MLSLFVLHRLLCIPCTGIVMCTKVNINSVLCRFEPPRISCLGCVPKMEMTLCKRICICLEATNRIVLNDAIFIFDCLTRHYPKFYPQTTYHSFYVVPAVLHNPRPKINGVLIESLL